MSRKHKDMSHDHITTIETTLNSEEPCHVSERVQSPSLRSTSASKREGDLARVLTLRPRQREVLPRLVFLLVLVLVLVLVVVVLVVVVVAVLVTQE